MKGLLPLTPEQFAIAEEPLRNPAPRSQIAAAKQAGVDLNLLLRQLRVTPEERFRDAENLINAISRIQLGTEDPRRSLPVPYLPIHSLRFPCMCSSLPQR